jgi:arachidonate 15-lipoxygenase
LPQNDTNAEQRKRQKQIKKNQRSYIWDLENPNVTGVPMSKNLPAEARPTLEWVITVTKVLIPIVDNLIANIADEVPHLLSIKETLDDITSSIEDVIFGKHWSLINAATTLLEDLIKKYTDYIHKELKAQRDEEGLTAYENLFQTLPLPSIARTFQHNKTFARFRVAGQNPMLIKKIIRLPDNFPVTDAGFKQVMGQADSLSAALADNRVYLLDYKELEQLTGDNSQSDTKQVFAPIALFAIAKGAESLMPVAIQAGQKKTDGEVIYAQPDNGSSSAYWRWQAAMSLVQVADGNYHELFVHLGRTHLLIEAFSVAMQRSLASEHPLNVLLTPHFEGTLFINKAAAGALIAPGGPIESIFGGQITKTQEAAGGDRLALDFYDYMLPRDLATRGVANISHLPDYPYRDDAILIWKAISEWTTAYVALYYNGDDDVTADTELTAFSHALMTEGRINDFRPIATRAQLSEVLTMVIFTGSAQHAAVNFPQSVLMTFSPAVTGSNWGKNPTTADSQTKWLATLPPLQQSLEQLSLLQILGGVYYRKLGEYRTNNFPYPDSFTDKRVTQSGGPLNVFRATLDVIEKVITERNQTREAYGYLLPSKVPPSINI